jgi:hypothetical protein
VKCISVKFKWAEISKIVLKWNEGLRSGVSIIIRIYIDHMRFAVYIFRLFLFNFVHVSYYVFLLICKFLSRYSVSL